MKLRMAYKISVLVFSLPIILGEYFERKTGEAYGIGFAAKIRLLLKFLRNTREIETFSWFVEHLAMAAKIMSVPPRVRGCVVECGCYKGGSTANLSLVCRLCGRDLEVFDSFEGLPEPGEKDLAHTLLFLKEVHTYRKHAFAARLDEVKANIARYGSPESCRFHKGFFEDTLKDFKEPVVFAFIDVDLRQSLEDCLKHLWPCLEDDCYLFCHEAQHTEIVELFFDRQWWERELGTSVPGFVGSGHGLPLVPFDEGFASHIGYTVKSPRSFKVNAQGPQE